MRGDRGRAGALVVRLDARDAGRSAAAATPGRYSMHDTPADVVALLDALELPAATLAGVSQGGMTRADRRGRASRSASAGLVLISTTPGGDDLPGPGRGAVRGRAGAPDWTDRAAVVRYLVELERPYGGSRFDEELMTRIAERTVDHAATSRRSSSYPFEVSEGRPVPRDRLPEIRVPTVVVHGTADPMFPLEHGRALAAAIPGARLVALDGFGHATAPARRLAALVERDQSPCQRRRVARAGGRAASVSAQVAASAR